MKRKNTIKSWNFDTTILILYVKSISIFFRPVKMKSFASNGKPYNVFRLTTTSTTTTTTTTTTSTTSTTTPSTTAISRDHEEDAKIEQNGSITWLGKFLMNGLPKKLFNFKAPYYPLSWFNQLNDVNSVNSHVLTNLV